MNAHREGIWSDILELPNRAESLLRRNRQWCRLTFHLRETRQVRIVFDCLMYKTLIQVVATKSKMLQLPEIIPQKAYNTNDTEGVTQGRVIG